ncbi:hypothetical protein AA309_17685 [Microvirga vignae]|uniref:Carrier domain-containing protein n=2 Tax=Microvirga vignae TaxID=1225564 RepID=A0A0H1R9R4_9HYPH|nr:hypothetical protein AA309_17685 [Microvirga vignae]
MSLAEMLLAQARSRPREIAVTDGKNSLSYAEFVERCLSVAHALRERGIGPSDRVGVFIESSVDLLVGVWSVLLAGGAYLPLATDYPEERLAHMTRDGGVSVIVSHAKGHAALSNFLLPVVEVIDVESVGDKSSIKVTDLDLGLNDLTGSDLAYVIFTSGTTGAPKGVAISHRAIVSQLTWLQTEHHLVSGQKILQKTPISFDAAQWELLAVCCGATVVMGYPSIHRDPAGIVQMIKAHDVTMLQAVPTLLQALVDDPEFAQTSTLKSIYSGGEALSWKLASRILNVKPDVTLVNLYGPTECTINATSFTVTREGLEHLEETVPLGFAAARTGLHILDDEHRPVPPGETGELYISGVQVAEGYLNRPEQTSERFVKLPPAPGQDPVRMYRSGDLVRLNPDGTLHFVGRADNQVKFRGYRIELDEIRMAIENHDWVKSAAVFVKSDARTGQPVLLAGVELNPRDASIMDQGDHGAHHQSKKSRLQVRAQLSDGGLRRASDLVGRSSVDLPGREETVVQRRRAFARKTYRFFDGGRLSSTDLLTLLERPVVTGPSSSLSALDLKTLGALMRNLGQFRSHERLLPKYAYASPGALYATQVHIELRNIADIPSGHYYYHPADHRLVLIRAEREEDSGPSATLHFIGNVAAIRPVYKNNILEVLEMETGHILGLLDAVLPEYGLALGRSAFVNEVGELLRLDEDHAYLGSFDIVPFSEREDTEALEIYVQAHGDKVDGLPSGTYRYRDGRFEPFSKHVVQQKHVIAINQQVYERSSAGVTFVNRTAEAWRRYIDLGRGLQTLQMNDIQIGLMSSGYSSKTGKDLVAARRIFDILREPGQPEPAVYFALAGKISTDQISHEGMREDAVHMHGPAELVRKDLHNILPDYMVPSRIVVIDQLPYSASGKVDVVALKQSNIFDEQHSEREFVPARTAIEEAISTIWRREMNLDDVSIRDDFFEIGGDSLQAVTVVLEINQTLGANLPIQVLFEDATIEKLARRITKGRQHGIARAVTLRAGIDQPIFLWPGLGGYPLNLRPLAQALETKRPVMGVQASGINPSEEISGSIEEMAAADVAVLRSIQPQGPYSLWGYSFGARVAYEVAAQLEEAGETVQELVFLAPGSPELESGQPVRGDSNTLFRDRSFLTILYSVFAHSIDPQLVEACVQTAKDEASFIEHVAASYPVLDRGLIERIVRLVTAIYGPTYGPEPRTRPLKAPATILRARGDSRSFVESASVSISNVVRIVDLEPDHYTVLKPAGLPHVIAALKTVAASRSELDDGPARIAA